MAELGLEEGRTVQAHRRTAVGMGPVGRIPHCQRIAEVDGRGDIVRVEQHSLRVAGGM